MSLIVLHSYLKAMDLWGLLIDNCIIWLIFRRDILLQKYLLVVYHVGVQKRQSLNFLVLFFDLKVVWNQYKITNYKKILWHNFSNKVKVLQFGCLACYLMV